MDKTILKQPEMICDISVIICTYNQAAMLQGALNSWLSVHHEKSDVELIIVDNNSTDHTQKVVASFRANLSYSIALCPRNPRGFVFRKE